MSTKEHSAATNNPLTTVICLTHNELQTTKSFLEYFFKYTNNFELIMVDNGSLDGTVDFLQTRVEQKELKLVKSSTNLGVIGGRNLGIQNIGDAEYIINLDNDQYVMSGWLEKLHRLMNQGYDIVGIDAWRLLPPGTGGTVVLGDKQTCDRSYFPYKHCTERKDKFTYVGAGGCLIKREVVDKIITENGDGALFSSRFGGMYFEDPHFCFQCIKAGFRIAWCYDCPVRHVGHQTINNQRTFNKRSEFLQSWKEFKEYWQPYYPEPVQM